MFERFTAEARAVVVGAVGHAERLGVRKVREEHLVLALLDGRTGRAAAVLAALGVDRRRESLERELLGARRRAGLSRADAEALAGLGIDLTLIVDRVEHGHGAGALDPGRTARGAAVRGPLFGPGYSREAKAVLKRALRMATERRERKIGDHHLLLALTAHPGVVAETLADHGAGLESVRRLVCAGVAGGGRGRAA
ncbi:Clp protease N-terminal domain-containing protein [Streptomyces sp. NPDC049906]|uniref:Clp protease N-terminal domain-containing protein n=1 Tax=Streptomyces sp. NPDC049906 TaxID=3155656 RepID=UPI00343369B5